ncbi:MAG: IS1380 family transposase [Candidatus Limnocylindrales bacterium]
MRSSHSLDRLHTAFDDDHLVADAGLLLPATLAGHLGLKELVERHLDLGAVPGRAHVDDKVLTLVLSALAGGDSIDDADALRAGGTGRVLGFTVKAASTLGTFLRSFRWGHVRQLDAVSREVLARAWAAGAGPGAEPLTIDLDSTICETYGLQKEGARHYGYTGVRGYHPLLAVAAGTGDVLMARLRGGHANTVRGAAHFLRETIGRVRSAGATGPLTVRADSGFYASEVVAVCRAMDVRFSITVRQHRSLHRLIEAIPEAAWTPIPYWLDGAADVAETSYTPFASEKDARPVRLIVRRVKPTPGSQLAFFALYDFHPCITDREGDTLTLEADHRRHAEIENAIRDLKYGVGLNHLPSGRFAANAAWLAVQVMAHNLARWTARIGLNVGIVTTKTLRRRLFNLAGRLTRSARRWTLHLPARWPWTFDFLTALGKLRAIPLLS